MGLISEVEYRYVKRKIFTHPRVAIETYYDKHREFVETYDVTVPTACLVCCDSVTSPTSRHKLSPIFA